MIKVNVYYVLSVKRLHVLAVQSVKIVVLVGMATVVRRAIMVNIASLLWKILRPVLNVILDDINQALVKQAVFRVLQAHIRTKQERTNAYHVQPTPKVQVQIQHNASLATSAKYQQQEVFNAASVKQALLGPG